jgi:hypothetical protein
MNEIQKEKIYRFGLSKFEDEYKELCDNWKSIDLKAQSTIVTCGIFYAGIFTLLSKLTNVDDTTKLVFTFVLLFLSLSLICAVKAIRIRDTEMPLEPESLCKKIDDAVVAPAIVGDQRINEIIWSISVDFEEANLSAYNANMDKSRYVKYAQNLLLVAALLAAIASAIQMWIYSNPIQASH